MHDSMDAKIRLTEGDRSGSNMADVGKVVIAFGGLRPEGDTGRKPEFMVPHIRAWGPPRIIRLLIKRKRMQLDATCRRQDEPHVFVDRGIQLIVPEAAAYWGLVLGARALGKHGH